MPIRPDASHAAVHPLGAPLGVRPDMVWIAGATFRMGSDRHYREEAPVRRASVDGFCVDRTPVTNRQFRDFVKATGYVTCAELAPDASAYPGALPDMLKAGSLVFTPPGREVDLRDWSQWWTFKFGADWRHPYGPRSSIGGLDDHPVVHVAFQDAVAYADWAGKALPTEAEWEYAARGGLDGAEFAWGDELTPGNRHVANTWQGAFPNQNLCTDGYGRTSPVGVFPPNGYGLYDMIGNVWEWTADWYAQDHGADAPRSCCVPRNPRGGSEGEASIPASPTSRSAARCSKAGRSCVRRTTAAAIARRRATPSRSIPPPVTSASAVSYGIRFQVSGIRFQGLFP